MTYLDQAVQAVERGLLPAVLIEGRPQQPLLLCERMARYNVPGFGVALIEQGEVAATRGFGVLDVGGAGTVTGGTLFPESDSAFFALELHETVTFVRDSDGCVEAVMVGDYERLDRTG